MKVEEKHKEEERIKEEERLKEEKAKELEKKKKEEQDKANAAKNKVKPEKPEKPERLREPMKSNSKIITPKAKEVSNFFFFFFFLFVKNKLNFQKKKNQGDDQTIRAIITETISCQFVKGQLQRLDLAGQIAFAGTIKKEVRNGLSFIF